MLTSFCDMTICTLADRYQHSSGSTGNCPYTSCCTFSKQIPNIFQAHWYQHLHFPSSCSGVSTSIFVHFLPHLFIVASLHWNWWKLMAVLAISFHQFLWSLPWSATHNTIYHFFISRLNILPWRWQQHVLPKQWYLSTTLNGVTSQNTVCNLNIFCRKNLKFSILTLVT